MQAYWEPHVDTHNVAYYDVSAVLYLASHADQFDGGAFAFHDADGDMPVYPKAGELLTFSSGAENPHSAGRVTAGARFAIACWFTFDEAKANKLAPPLERSEAPSSHPLALCSLERSLASAAACCLAANDPMRQEIEEALAAGRPMAPLIGAASSPVAWLERRTTDALAVALSTAASSSAAVTEAVVPACTDEEGGEERLVLGPLRAAVCARSRALSQAQALVAARERAAAAAGGGAADDFDVFDLA